MIVLGTWLEIKKAKWQEQEGTCEYCGRIIAKFVQGCLHHVKNQSCGGKSVYNNAELRHCEPCEREAHLIYKHGNPSEGVRSEQDPVTKCYGAGRKSNRSYKPRDKGAKRALRRSQSDRPRNWRCDTETIRVTGAWDYGTFETVGGVTLEESYRLRGRVCLH